MTGAICNVMNTAILPTGKMTELVRGCDQELKQRLAPLVRQRDVSLDLRNVERIDAAGIAVLISLYGWAQEAGHSFTVANASHRVAEILALVGLDKILLSHNTGNKSHSEQCLERPAA
jgi:anti-anti-sigma factor